MTRVGNFSNHNSRTPRSHEISYMGFITQTKSARFVRLEAYFKLFKNKSERLFKHFLENFPHINPGYSRYHLIHLNKCYNFKKCETSISQNQDLSKKIHIYETFFKEMTQSEMDRASLVLMNMSKDPRISDSLLYNFTNLIDS